MSRSMTRWASPSRSRSEDHTVAAAAAAARPRVHPSACPVATMDRELAVALPQRERCVAPSATTRLAPRRGRPPCPSSRRVRSTPLWAEHFGRMGSRAIPSMRTSLSSARLARQGGTQGLAWPACSGQAADPRSGLSERSSGRSNDLLSVREVELRRTTCCIRAKRVSKPQLSMRPPLQRSAGADPGSLRAH